MAIFRPIHGELRGRIGANVYSHNKGGDYVRLGTIPTNPQTTRQQTTRSQLGTAAAAWTTTLSAAQRDLWDVFAGANPIKNSLGEDILISGLAWYVKVATMLADAGQTAVTAPPVAAAPLAVLSLSVDMASGQTIDVTWTGVLGAAEFLQTWVSLPVSQGSSPNQSQTRLAGYTASGPTSPEAVTTPHGFQTGERVVCFVRVCNEEGLCSAFVQAIDDIDFV